MNRLSLAVLFALVVGNLSLRQTAHAQDGQQVLQGFLKSLVDAQKDRRAPTPTRPPVSRTREIDVSELRDALHHFHEEADRLVVALTADARRSPTLRYQLAEAIRIRDTALWLEDQAMRTDNPDSLHGDFARLDRDWRALSRHLAGATDLGTTGRQCVGSLNGHHRSLCNHFGMPVVDITNLPRQGNAQLLQATQALVEEVDGILDRVTLAMLLESRNATRMLSAANQFHHTSEHFAEAVATGEPATTLAAEFRGVSEAWTEFAGQFQNVRDPIVLQSLREIERSLVAVRDTLRGGGPRERRSLLQLAGVLEQLSEQLESEFEKHVEDNQVYLREFRRNGERLVEAFGKSSHNLRHAAEDRDLDQTRRHFFDAAGQWDRFCTECLARLGPMDRAHLAAIASQVNPVLDEMKAQMRP